ncbi:MAG: hypothetical protein ACOYMA_00020 [Bacteroidia bacterium]
MKKDLRLYCAGCVVLNMFPKQCSGCPNYNGDYNKYNSLFRNYHYLSLLFDNVNRPLGKIK